MTRQRLDRSSQHKLGIERKVSAVGKVTGETRWKEPFEGDRAGVPLLHGWRGPALLPVEFGTRQVT